MNLKRTASLLLTALLLLGLTACGEKETAQENDGPSGIAVQVEEVSMASISNENTVSGQLAADKETMIMISSAAKCTAVNFHAGDTVKEGDILCTLDLGSMIASYNAASIGYESASQSYHDQSQVFASQIALQQQNLANLKALYEIGAASQLEIDQAELQLQSAIATRNSTLAQLEAGMENAKSGLEQLDLALENVDENGNVIAPMDGVLASMSAVAGSFVSTAMPVAVITDNTQMKITVMVSESLVSKLNSGDKADVYVSSADKHIAASVRSVDRTANMQTKLYTVTLSVPADVEGLLPGMFADVTFHTDLNDNAVVIPTEAILTSGETQYVYIVEGETAKHVEITTGITGSGVTQVTSGLTAGDQLVTVGQAYLHDGDLVRVVPGTNNDQEG